MSDSLAQKLHYYKKLGMSDARIAQIAGIKPGDIKNLRNKHNIKPVFKKVDSCAAEFEAHANYMYSCYEGSIDNPAECESIASDNKKVVILGGGPNRIGQGIEFDYACVHASFALKEVGIESIMINCNPETVSTDYDTSDRLYFEPLTAEDVIEVIKKEQSSGELLGVIVQFGGQTPLKLAHALQDANIPIIGTKLDSIDLAEDRDRFRKLLEELKIKQPESAIANTPDEAISQANNIGYPILARPSYVLGGRAMAIIDNEAALKMYLERFDKEFNGHLFDNPVLIDSYLQGATEVDVDALSDGKEVFVAGIMQHIEEAGIHSGDSACTLPPYSLSAEAVEKIKSHTTKLALALNVVGLMNVQYAIKDGEVYVIEVNPRASRTVPFVAKTIGIPVAKIATKLMCGYKLSEFNLTYPELQHIAVKEAVFPFARFPGVDVILGPEMKSTGEAMGIDKDFGSAYAKAQISSGNILPTEGTVFISVKNSDKDKAIEAAKHLDKLGFNIIATRGTAKAIDEADIKVTKINKVREGRPHIVDAMLNGEVNLVINTTEGAQAIMDSFSIRSTAVNQKIPYTTTITGGIAIVKAIESLTANTTLAVKTMQEHNN